MPAVKIQPLIKIETNGDCCSAKCQFFSRESITDAPAYCNLFERIELKSLSSFEILHHRCSSCRFSKEIEVREKSKTRQQMRMGKVYITSQYTVDLDNNRKVDEAKDCLVEDITNAVKDNDEMAAYIKVEEDSSLLEADIPEFLKDEDDDDEIYDDLIDIIASGYEWECPHCEMLNHEIELTETVMCSNCYRHFRTNDHHHAYGK